MLSKLTSAQILTTATVMPRRRATTFSMNSVFRLRVAVEKKRRARSIATVTAPMVALIIRKTTAESMTTSQFVPGGGSRLAGSGLEMFEVKDINEAEVWNREEDVPAPGTL